MHNKFQAELVNFQAELVNFQAGLVSFKQDLYYCNPSAYGLVLASRPVIFQGGREGEILGRERVC